MPRVGDGKSLEGYEEGQMFSGLSKEIMRTVKWKVDWDAASRVIW
jgi:hypothetical protein